MNLSNNASQEQEPRRWCQSGNDLSWTPSGRSKRQATPQSVRCRSPSRHYLRSLAFGSQSCLGRLVGCVQLAAIVSLRARFVFLRCRLVAVCFVAEYLSQQRKNKAGNPATGFSWEPQRTLRFWLRDSLRVCLLYLTTCVIGDIPMAVNYFAAVRGWPLHWWWSNAVVICLLVMVAACWTLDRIYERRF